MHELRGIKRILNQNCQYTMGSVWTKRHNENLLVGLACEWYYNSSPINIV